MAEEQITPEAERYEYTGSGKYLSSSFTERAPTDQGIDTLRDWLEEELPNEIRANITGEMDFWPTVVTDLLKTHQPEADKGSLPDRLAVDSLLNFPKKIEFMVNHGLWTYVANRSLLSHREQQQLSGEQLARPSKFTVENLTERGKAQRELLVAMGMSQEAAIIDHLFEKVKSTSAKKIEAERT